MSDYKSLHFDARDSYIGYIGFKSASIVDGNADICDKYSHSISKTIGDMTFIFDIDVNGKTIGVEYIKDVFE